MAHRGSRGIALSFVDHGTRRGWGVSVTPWSLFTPGKDPVPIVQEAGWAPGPVWTGAENLAPTGIRSQDRPAHNQSLYWLSYPAHSTLGTTHQLKPTTLIWVKFQKLLQIYLIKSSSNTKAKNGYNSTSYSFMACTGTNLVLVYNLTLNATNVASTPRRLID
jgi:hypothetical protein